MNKSLFTIPTKAGCYIFKDERGQILYIGKAKNLRRRISNHLRKGNKSKFQNLIKDWEVILTNNVKEALVLEQNLIKNYQPRFNYCLRDDRSYPYIKITSDRNPRYSLVKKVDSVKKDTYFGPFPDGSKAAEMLQILEQVFPLAKCKGNLGKPCLYYSLGKCSGHCFKSVDFEYYQKVKKELGDFFKGKIQKVRKQIQKALQKSLTNYEFELAKKEKKMLDNINFFAGKQNIEFKDRQSYDFLGFYVKNGFLYCYLLLYRYGKLSNTEARIFTIQENFMQVNQLLESYLYQFYQKNTPPKIFYLPELIEEIKIVGEEIGFICQIPQRGRKKEILQMAQQNAQQTQKRHFSEQIQPIDKIELLEKLGKFLRIPTPFLIEVLDISNLFQQDIVAGFLACINGDINRHKSKTYYLKNTSGGDVTWIKAACQLHYKNKLQNLLPQLLIVDGGNPQLNAVIEIWRQLNLNIPVIGLVKNQKHQTEKIIIFDFLDMKIKRLDFSNVNIKNFLSNLQEEVHRYAIASHRRLHLKNTLNLKN